jgi:excisionase family DNA binding protein
MVTVDIACSFCGAPTEFFTAEQVARLMGKEKRTITRWLESGRIPGEMVIVRKRRMWRIPAAAIAPLIS